MAENLSVDTSRTTVPTLIAALFYDLSPDKDLTPTVKFGQPIEVSRPSALSALFFWQNHNRGSRMTLSPPLKECLQLHP